MISKDESHHPQTILIEASSVKELGHLCYHYHHRSIYVCIIIRNIYHEDYNKCWMHYSYLHFNIMMSIIINCDYMLLQVLGHINWWWIPFYNLSGEKRMIFSECKVYIHQIYFITNNNNLRYRTCMSRTNDWSLSLRTLSASYRWWWWWWWSIQ